MQEQHKGKIRQAELFSASHKILNQVEDDDIICHLESRGLNDEKIKLLWKREMNYIRFF